MKGLALGCAGFSIYETSHYQQGARMTNKDMVNCRTYFRTVTF